MNRCWIKYLIGLLEHSRSGLIFADFEAQMGLGDGQKMPKHSEIDFELSENLPDNMDQITAEKVDTLQGANKLHKMVETLVKESQSHFLFDGFVTDHVELAQVLITCIYQNHGKSQKVP